MNNIEQVEKIYRAIFIRIFLRPIWSIKWISNREFFNIITRPITPLPRNWGFSLKKSLNQKWNSTEEFVLKKSDANYDKV